MTALTRLFDAVGVFLLGLTAAFIVTLAFFAAGGSLTLPFGGSPKELIPLTDDGYKPGDRAALDDKIAQLAEQNPTARKYRALLVDLKQ